MAYCGDWGCFIHIPKTGGNWVNKVLRTKFKPGRNNGPGHGFPTRWDYKPIFAFYREPAKWLRSVWGHRMGNNWTDYPHNDAPWATFLYITNQYRSDNFTEFALNLMDHNPGIISWFYQMHTPPNVIINWIENPWILDQLGCDITLPHANVNNDLPPITPQVQARIFSKEYKLYNWMNPDGIFTDTQRKKFNGML